ncbi:thiamine pyrophosphate-binding protein [Aestuariimicrobium ganziense]|uniref:thiamine pyrophosphate-binding protein n=1 Tax=Aestuariimicrobium ganziense TaxID=2773677 RepID=UPI001942EDB2|nr:thiamine pyrophosphate-binding protein [Aestuariimicrobium ganziense]
MARSVAHAVGAALAEAGVDHVFGVIGSGNLVVTNAMVAAGSRFVAARHEGGAATMADAFARVSGRVAAVSVHQGCGLTNALTGIAEAAKSRTPMVVVSAESTQPSNNFFVDQDAMARAVGAVPMRVDDASTAVVRAAEAVRVARDGRRTVLLNLPLEVQRQAAVDSNASATIAPAPTATVADEAVRTVAEALASAERPIILAGRGARDVGPEIIDLARRTGALLSVSAVVKGLFADDEFNLDIAGGFATPAAEQLFADADLVVSLGCGLRSWTTRGGWLFPQARVVQVDDSCEVLGLHLPKAEGVLADVPALVRALLEQALPEREGYRTAAAREVIASSGRWQDVAFDDLAGDGLVDPRALTVALDRMLPRERVIGVDSGNFMGYPTMFLDVPDADGFCFTQAFQCIGLGLATAIGAALAQPDRLPVAALGDGGALMGAAELETVNRLGLGMLVVVYDDSAYGAEVHHFAPMGEVVDLVEFPDTDIAAIGRGYGLEAVTVREMADLAAVEAWINGPRTRSMLVDAKIARDGGSWWLEHAFKGH